MSEFEEGPDPDLIDIPSGMPSDSLGALCLGDNSDHDQFLFHSPADVYDRPPATRWKMPTSNANHRQSLAFELAAAMDPDQNTTSSLLSALGIEEEDEDAVEGACMGEEEFEGYGQQDVSHAARSRFDMDFSAKSPVTSASHVMVTPSRLWNGSPSSRYDAQSPLGFESTANTTPMVGGCSPSPSRLETPVLDDSSFDIGRAVLETSIASTNSFLDHLKCFNTLQTTETETHVERLVGDVVKTMTEQAKAREGQIRELREMDGWLSKVDRRVLADLEAIAEPEVDHDDSVYLNVPGKRSLTPPTPLTHGFNTRLRTMSLGHSSDDSQSTSPATPSSPSPEFDDILVEDPLSPTAVRPALSQLRFATSSLVNALSNISEHTQVSRAASTDVGRKLKSVKAMTVQWTKEAEILDMSSLDIELWERKEGLARGQGVGGRYKTRMLEATLAAEQLLEEAHQRAIHLLSPPSS